MTKKRRVIDKNVDSYKIPSKEILQHRNEFFDLWRRSDDRTTVWLKRVEKGIRRCKFPMNLSELLLIDRFISGLNAKEMKSIQKLKKSWTLKQLLEHFSKKNNDTAYIEVTINEEVHQIEGITLDVVKSEPNEDECLQKDPFNESKEVADSFIDCKPAVDVIDEILPPEENILGRGEPTIFQQALNEDIDYEMLDNAMEFECEDYKFSVKGVATTVLTTATDTSVIDNSAAFTSATDIIISDIDENLSDRPFEEEPNHDQRKHLSDATKAPDSTEIDAVTNAAAEAIDDNLSRNSAQKQKHTNIEQKYRQYTTDDGRIRYLCNQCDRSFYCSFKMNFHIKIAHTHLCDICDKRYITINNLEVHARIHTGERPYKCDQCDVSYAYKSILAKHIKSVHLELRPHLCQICGKAFVNREQLNHHLAIHSSLRPFVCDICRKGFKRKNTLRSHKKRVHEEQIRSHVCPICDKRFLVAAELKKHSLIHTGERPHTCGQCNKTFSQLTSLKLHEDTVHKGIRRYACSHCDKQFKRANHLQQHLTIHTGEKAYKCDQCDKSFALGHHLSSHKKSVHHLKA